MLLFWFWHWHAASTSQCACWPRFYLVSRFASSFSFSRSCFCSSSWPTMQRPVSQLAKQPVGIPEWLCLFEQPSCWHLVCVCVCVRAHAAHPVTFCHNVIIAVAMAWKNNCKNKTEMPQECATAWHGACNSMRCAFVPPLCRSNQQAGVQVMGSNQHFSSCYCVFWLIACHYTHTFTYIIYIYVVVVIIIFVWVSIGTQRMPLLRLALQHTLRPTWAPTCTLHFLCAAAFVVFVATLRLVLFYFSLGH